MKSRNSKSLLILAVVLALALSAAQRAEAATLYWDTNGAVAGSGNAGGVWDLTTNTTTNLNWSTNLAGTVATAAWADNSNAVFSAGTDGTGNLTITTPTANNKIIVRDLTVEEGNVTLTGAGNIRLMTTADSTWSVAAGASLTMDQQINNNNKAFNFILNNEGPVTLNGAIASLGTTAGGRLIKNGSGALTLNANNTLPNGITLNAGTLNILNTKALGAAGANFIINGGTIDASTKTITLANIGPQNWNGDFTFKGSFDLNLATCPVTLGGNRLLTVDNNNGANPTANLTVGGVIDDGASTCRLTKAGNGTLTLSGANTFKGGLTLNTGTLILGNGAAVGTGAFTINGGTLDSNAAGIIFSNTNPQNWNGNFVFGGTQDLDLGYGQVTLGATPQVTVTKGNLTVNGAIGGGFGITKLGSAGTLILAGANTYTGDTTVSEGKLMVDGGHTTAGNYTVASGATLGGQSTITAAGGKSLTVQGGGTLAPGNPNGTLTYDGTVNLNDNSLLTYSLDTSTSGSNSFLIGKNVNLGAGIALTILPGGSWGTEGEVWYPLMLANSTLTNTGGFSGWSVHGSGLGTHSYQFVLDSGNPNQVDLHVWTPITSAWIHNGDGAWNATGNWNPTTVPTGLDAQALFNDPSVTTPGTATIPTGGATVGTIKFASTVGSYEIASANPAADKLTIAVSGGTAIVAADSGTHTISAPLTINSPTDFTVSTATDPLTALKLTGAVTASGASTLTINRFDPLNPSLTYGTLTMGSTAGPDILSGVSSNIVISGGALHLLDTAPAGGIQVNDKLDGTGTAQLIAEITTGTRTLGGVLSSQGTLGTVTKRGGGTLELGGSAANTFAGTYIVEAGTLKMSKSAAVAAIGSIVQVLGDTVSGGTLDLNGQSQTVAQLAGNLTPVAAKSRVTNNATGTPAILTVTGTSIFDGELRDGASALGLTATGILTLTNTAHSNSGPTTIAGATTGTNGVLLADLSPNTNLVLGDSVVTSRGVLQNNAATSFTRALGTGPGQVQWAYSGGFAAGNINDTANGHDLTVNIGGASALLVWGSTPHFVPAAGELVFGSTIADKTVTWQNPIQLTSSSDTGPATRGIRVLAPAATVPPTPLPPQVIIAGVISDDGVHAGTLSKAGAGVLVLTASNTYTGGTALTANVLRVGNDHALGTGALTMSASTTVLSSDGATARTLANPVNITANNVSFGDATYNGLLTIGQVDFGTGNRDLNINSDVVFGAGTTASGKGMNLKKGEGTLTIRGTADWTGGTNVEVRDGSIVIDGATVLNANGGWRLDSITTGGAGTATTSIINGGLLSLPKNTSNMNVGFTGADPGSINILNVGGIGTGPAPWGTLRMIASAADGTITMGATGSEAYVNLNNNGVIETTGILYAVGGTATCLFNFDGGTLKALQNSTAFLPQPSSGAVSVLDLGATFDSNGFNLTVGADLHVGGDFGTGGLTKTGSGNLILSGALSYGGATTVNGGVLTLQGSGNTYGNALAAGVPKTIINAGGLLAINTTGSMPGWNQTGELHVLANGALTVGDGVSSTESDTILTKGVFDNGAFYGFDVGAGVTRDQDASKVKDTLGLAKSGPGTLNLTGLGGYTYGTKISGGLVSVASDSALGAPSSHLIFDGGGLQITNATTFPTLNPLRTVDWGLGAWFDIADTANAFTLPALNIPTTALTKSGPGTLQLAATSNVTGTLNVNGPLTLNTGVTLDTLTAQTMIGGAGSTTGGILRVTAGGVLTTNGIQIAYTGAANSLAGSLVVDGGTVTTSTTLGDTNFAVYAVKSGLSSGSLIVNSGSFTAPRIMSGVGTADTDSQFTMLISGTGTVNNTGDFYVARHGRQIGTLTLTGGTLDRSLATGTLRIANNGNATTGASRGELNLAGGVILSPTQVLAITQTAAVGVKGTLNLDKGTLQASSINAIVDSTTTSNLNFNGGTLKAGTGAFTLQAVGAVTQTVKGAYVNGAFGGFDGGAVFDSNGQTMTVAANLLTPVGVGTGNGVTALAKNAAGSGYTAMPYVQITDSTGTGATGYAEIDTTPGSLTYGQVTAVHITNPGVGYSSSPTVTLVGGGGIGATASFTVGANTSGGLTKKGAGTLVLNGTGSNYTGNTTVNAGSLVAGMKASVPGYGSNKVTVTGAGSAFGVTLGGTSDWTEGDIDTPTTGLLTTVNYGPGTNVAVNVDSTFTYPYTKGIAWANQGLTKTGAGTLVLPLANTYTGATIVNSGTLKLTGSLASTAVTVSGVTPADPMLTGTGPITGTVTVAESGVTGAVGHLVPGDLTSLTPAVLTIGGLVANTGALFDFDLGSNATAGVTYDQIAVGAAGITANAGTVNVNPLAEFGLGTYNLFTNTSSTLLNSLVLNSVGLPGTWTYSLISNPSHGIDLVVGPLGPPKWQGVDNAPWSTGTNWTSGSAPNAAGAGAIFDGTSGGSYVNVDAAQTVGSLTFDRAGKYTLTGAQLTMDTTTGGAATITLTTGSHEINAPLLLNKDLSIASNSAGLTLSGNIDGAGKTISTTGNVTLSGVNSYGGTSVDNGTVTFANALALPAGSNVTTTGTGVVVFSSGYTGVISSGTGAAPVGSPAPVPEPGTIVLLLAAALMGAGAWLRRKV